MRRIRESVWAIALWGVVLLVYLLIALLGNDDACATAAEGEPCTTELILAVLGVALALLWVLGSLVILATNPRGITRSFLVSVMVNTLALFATLAILSLVRLPASDGTIQPLLSIPDDVLVVAVVFAVVNALARPVLFVVFGRLILRTLGLAIVAMNAILFWLVGELSAAAGSPWITPDPRFLWIVVDSIVFTVILATLHAFLGLDRPRLDAPGNSRTWRFIDRLPARRRSALIESIRLEEVYDAVSRFGLEIAVGGTALAPVRRLGDRMMGRSSAELDAMSTPAKVRVMLQQLGPTFVKVGQMASSRADALPEDWRSELEKLQSTVPPFPWEQARDIIASELGADPATLFATIDETPFGAASIAQVHRATLHDGTQVVVKVQRPGIQAKVRADLGVIQELAAVGEARLAVARQMDATGLAKEFADGVIEELDYTTEAYHARRLADVVASVDGVRVPAIVGELSAERVLTMEFVPGVKATRADELDPSIDREQVARTFMRAVVKQVMVEGFFHADPHPGNIMLDPTTGVITFLDLGLVGELGLESRLELLALLWALRSRDPRALAGVSLRLCVATGTLDEQAYAADVERLFYQYWVYGQASFSRMMGALFATLRAHGLRMRKELTLAVKAITQAEELLRAIQPGMQLVDTATQEAERQLRSELTPERVTSLALSRASAVVQYGLQQAIDGDGEIGAFVASVLMGRTPSAAEASSPDARLLAERIDGIAARVDRAADRSTRVAAVAGVAVSLSLVLAALILRPDVEVDGPVLIVGCLVAAAVGALGLILVRGRGGPPA